MNDFANGVNSMARNCKAALQLIDQGRWTIGDAHRWIDAVINQDAAYLETAIQQINAKLAEETPKQ